MPPPLPPPFPQPPGTQYLTVFWLQERWHVLHHNLVAGIRVGRKGTYQAGKGELPDEQFGAALVPPDLPQGHGARPVPVGLLYRRGKPMSSPLSPTYR